MTTEVVTEESRQTFPSLMGKVVLVTGGSRGLGLEMARAFASQGSDLVVASRKLDACERVAADITAEHGTRALPVAANVSSWTDTERLVDAAYAEYGRVDVLINNAGMSPLYDSVEGITEELYDKVLAVNLKGPFRLCALVGARMAAQGGGSIVNISSVASTHPEGHTLPYAAAKAGLNAMTIGMARAYGPSVRVNTIVPGMFRTDVSKHWDLDAVDETARATFALQRVGEPHEIVGAALYLASDLASYTTAAMLNVDGGY